MSYSWKFDEVDEVLVVAFMKMMRIKGKPRKFYERKANEGLKQARSSRRTWEVIMEALDIAFRDEARA